MLQNLAKHKNQKPIKSNKIQKPTQNLKNSTKHRKAQNSANPKNSANHSKIGLLLLFTKSSFYQKARGFVVRFFDFIVFCVA